MHVASLYVYPVKSCGGMRVDRCQLVETGLEFDRQWMLVDDDGVFLSQRKDPTLAKLRVEIVQVELAFNKAQTVQDCLVFTFDGQTILQWPTGSLSPVRIKVRVHDDSLLAFDQGDRPARVLSEIVGRPVRLVKKSCFFHRPSPGRSPTDVQVGFADAYPLLLTTTTSLGDLNRRLEQPVLFERFRPNIVIADVDEPYVEDRWGSFTIGSHRFEGRSRCTRCAIVSTDQQTSERSKEPLSTLLRYRVFPGSKSPCFGLNVDHLDRGQIAVGDLLHIQSLQGVIL